MNNTYLTATDVLQLLTARTNECRQNGELDMRNIFTALSGIQIMLDAGEPREKILSFFSNGEDGEFAKTEQQSQTQHAGEVEHDASGCVAWLENPYKLPRGTKIYTAPVQPSQALELSDEEIDDLWYSAKTGANATQRTARRFARAIIAAISAKGPDTSQKEEI